jgi:hypothetical protein
LPPPKDQLNTPETNSTNELLPAPGISPQKSTVNDDRFCFPEEQKKGRLLEFEKQDKLFSFGSLGY